MTTDTYKIKPITLVSGTVRTDLDPQFERRAIHIPIDASEEQTKRIAEFEANRTKQKIEVTLGKRLATDEEVSKQVYIRFIKQFKPVEVIIPFPSCLTSILPMDSIRVRGDFKKAEAFVKLYASFNLKRLPSVKGFKVCTPEIAIEALKLIAPFLSSMLAKTDDRTIPLLKALLDLGYSGDKGSKLTKAIRDKLALKRELLLEFRFR